MALFKKKKKEENIKIGTADITEHAKDWNVADGQLVIDVYETDKELVVQSAVGGIKNNRIEISLENDILIIRGERENPVKDENKKYFSQECYYGPFSREIILPREIDTSRIEAKVKDGILVIRMPKIERAKNKKIEVED
ncbi:MAG: Hsp20/alpha crystallin family protein [Candidatus Paceibacterota bacterium]|jgi:HSP20 family protein|nr:Hsp20/alpha crystallin family protein [Candidatus Paceibacterota bacterium]MDD5555365.1 Hsp20/alpha crystallin family protein [Candidatus Paceibacterota bacterium]